jgi:hypothetical protein
MRRFWPTRAVQPWKKIIRIIFCNNVIPRFTPKLTQHNMTLRCMQKKGIRINEKWLLICIIKEKPQTKTTSGFVYARWSKKSGNRKDRKRSLIRPVGIVSNRVETRAAYSFSKSQKLYRLIELAQFIHTN